MAAAVVRLFAPGSYFGDSGDRRQGRGQSENAADLPYVIELWDSIGGSVEEMLGQVRHASLGWASYYAAITAFPGRKVTLRLAEKILANSTYPK